MVGWEYPPNITGGLGIACKGLVNSLAQKGISVHFMVPKLFGNEECCENVELIDPSVIKTFLTQEEIQEIENLRANVYSAEIRSSAYAYCGEESNWQSANKNTNAKDSLSEIQGGYTDRIFSEISEYAAWAKAYAKKVDFDIVHAHDWMSFPAGKAASEAAKKPLVCHVHATEYDRSGDNVNERVFHLEKEALDSCDKAVTVSEYTKSILVNRYNISADKIQAVHNGVDFENYDHLNSSNRGIDKDTKVVLFLGRITFQKGPDYFVRAAQKVLEKTKNVRFVMAGTGDMYHRMISFASGLGIGKYFHYTGFLNKDEVRRAYLTSDLYVMPSVSEPFGIAPLEAMNYRVPAIISKQSGVSEILQNVIKIDFWDVDALAENILHVTKYSGLSNDLKHNGYLEAKNVSWERSADKLLNLYHSLN